MYPRHSLTLAALVVSVGGLHAQQIQVRFATPVSSGPTDAKKPVSSEFKPDATASPDPKSLDVPPDVQQKVNDLVPKLASPVYKERVLASKELAGYGRLALPALAEVIRAGDEPEAVERAEALLPKAQALDMKARVACFLADADGKYEHTLPGWGKFKETAGNTKASRELFAEALKNKATHQMLMAAERRDTEEAANVLGTFVAKIQGYYGNRFGGQYEQPVTPKTAELLVALFLESQFSDKQVVLSMPNMGWGGGGQYFTVATSLHNSDFSGALSNRAGKYTEPIRKVLQRWMDTRETANGCNQAWSFAGQMFGRKPALKYAARVLAADSNPNTQYIKTNILQQLGSEGAKDYLPDIVKCFDDTQVHTGVNSKDGQYHEVQIRDYALAVALQLSDLKPTDYGMTATGSGTGKVWHQTAFYFQDERDAAERGNQPGGRVIRGGVRPAQVEDPKKADEKKDDKAKKLSADDKRKAAFKKWADWEANGKKVEPKKDDPKKAGPVTDGDAEAAAKAAAQRDQQQKEDAIKKEAAAKEAAAKEAAKKEAGEKK